MSEQRVLAVFSARLDREAREKIARGEWPRKDFFAIADALAADVIDYESVERSRFGRAVAQLLGVPCAQAALAFLRRQRYDAIFTDGEHIGLPLGLLLCYCERRPRHVTIGHLLNTTVKRALLTKFKAGRGVDLLLLHASLQRSLALHDLGLPRRKLALQPYQVDVRFWQSNDDPEARDPIICAAGLEYRDYATLIAAAAGLPVRLVIAAGSRWSKHGHGLHAGALPANVTVTTVDYCELRALYARARFVIVPLHPVTNQAGVTTILEAMAMSRAVVVTATPGQSDVVRGQLCTRDGPAGASFGGPRAFGAPRDLAEAETGLYVPPRDAAALRAAIRYLLDRPDEAKRMGSAGRRLVATMMSLDRFAADVAAMVRSPAPVEHSTVASRRGAVSA